ncbi:MAG: hypothetical protein ACM33V_12855 [Chloroflexota bacterium]
MMSKQISYAALSRYLTRATVIFLTLPYLIFFYGWLYWWLAITMTVVCLLPIVWAWKRPQEASAPVREAAAIKLWQIMGVCAVALLFVLISGIGGWGWQTGDWTKHNTLLRDLVGQPWPLFYQLEGVRLPLVYYLAYYLPAALIGKAFGWAAANHALLIESWIGLSLTFLWGSILIKHSWWKAVLLVAFFSGMDALGYLLITPVSSMFLGEPTTIYHFEWWSIGWAYSSFATLLFWVPGQGFVGWLATALLLDEMFNHQRKYTLWYLALTTLWSPFVTVGLLPFVIADWVSEPQTLYAWVRTYALPNLCGVLLGTLTGFMYLAKFYPLPPQVGGKIVFGFVFSLSKSPSEAISGLILLILFWLLEGGLYGILTWKLLDRNDRQSRLILMVGLLYLAILPFFYYGQFNDLLQRSSIPALFALSVIVGRAILNYSQKRGLRLALIVMVAIGVVGAFITIGFQFEGMIKNGALWHLPSFAEVSTLPELQRKAQEEAFEIPGLQYTSFLSQYISSGDAPFFQWFVRQ